VHNNESKLKTRVVQFLINRPESQRSCKNWDLIVRLRVTLRLAVYRQSLHLGDKPLRLTTSDLIFQLNTCSYIVHSPYVTSSLKRGCVCRLQLLLVLASAVILRSESRGTHDHILLPQIWDSPNLEGQVPTFTSPRNRVARLYPHTLGSIFVASYVWQGYGGGIRPLLHTGFLTEMCIYIYILFIETENNAVYCIMARILQQTNIISCRHLSVRRNINQFLLYGDCGLVYVSPKRRFTQDLHGATSQKTAFFILN
jgi:hypothetical protein